MKVALVHMRHARTGGTERYLNHLAVHLAELGHDVSIVCRRHESPPHPAVRFEVLRALAIGGAHRMWAFAKAVEQHLARVRYDVVFGLGKTWSQDVIRMGGGCYQTYVDLVQNGPAQPPGRHFKLLDRRDATDSRRGIGSKILVSVLRKRWLRTRLALAIEARALAPGACLRVITNSTMVAHDVMRRYDIPADTIAVISNGVDLERFHPRHRAGAGATLRRQCGFEMHHRVVVFLATGYRRKGLDRLLEVFPALCRERPDVRLLVVGYESGLDTWERRVRHLGLDAAVRFLGGRRDPEACYGAGDLYVLPTRYDPFANSTLEALASGLPVITTDANGGCEVMAHGEHGAILQGADDTHALLRALYQWTDRLRLQQGRKAARACAEGHSVEKEMAASTTVLLQAAALKKVTRGEAW